MNKILSKIIVNLINFYQVFFSFDHGILAIFAPGGACRYDISCSEYTKQAIIQYGVIKGSWMGVKRAWSCR